VLRLREKRRRATREPYDLTLRVAELAGIEREQARKATEQPPSRALVLGSSAAECRRARAG
jgi:hypothetical protein